MLTRAGSAGIRVLFGVLPFAAIVVADIAVYRALAGKCDPLTRRFKLPGCRSWDAPRMGSSPTAPLPQEWSQSAE
ncbi:MAG TPA: hypothetical protein VF749_12020 [Candidatus Acidoferrum sp.]